MENIQFITDNANDRLIGVITENGKIEKITFCQGLHDVEYCQTFIQQLFDEEMESQKIKKTCDYLRDKLGMENIISCAKHACEIFAIIELKSY